MKYVKNSIGTKPDGSMLYPVNYENVGRAVDHLYFHDDIGCNVLLLIPDKDFKVEGMGDGMEVITEAAAKAISEANETRVETLIDEVKLRRIELKVALGVELTKAETDCINPTHPTSIFGVTKILADRATVLAVKESANTELAK
jgi:hypothetical protein